MDVFVWISQAEDIPSISSLPGYDFERILKVVIAEEMSVPSDRVEPGKVDIIDVRPLYSSDTKKLVLYVYGYPVGERMEYLPERQANIIRRTKELLNLPEDEQCVSFSFRRVEDSDWGKG